MKATVKRLISTAPSEMLKKVEQKKEQNTLEMLDYMDSKKERVPPGDFALLSAPVSLYVSIDLWYNIHIEIRFIVLIIQSNQR